MRGIFVGGICDAHNHPVGGEPLPQTLPTPCPLVAGVIEQGRYVLSGIRKAADHDLPSATEVAIYEWKTVEATTIGHAPPRFEPSEVEPKPRS